MVFHNYKLSAVKKVSKLKKNKKTMKKMKTKIIYTQTILLLSNKLSL